MAPTWVHTLLSPSNRLDSPDLTSRDTQERDGLPCQRRGKAQILDNELDDAAETAVVFRRGENDPSGTCRPIREDGRYR